MKFITSLFVAVFLVASAYHAQSQDPDKSITAQQIIQRAIDSSGGDKLFENIRNVETTSKVVTGKGDTLLISVKRMNFEKYLVSTLGLGIVNTTKVYNAGKAVMISNLKAEAITDPIELEALRLQSFLSIDYGYKKLGYSFERISDQKFQNFDCFVVLVTSPLGQTSGNYYDKKTGHLLMIMHPSLNRTIFIDHYKTKGITCFSKALIADTPEEVTTSTLIGIDYNENLDSNWFNIPVAGTHKAPETFKTGTFNYLNQNQGSKIVRDKNKQTEISGDSRKEYKIEWSTNNDYLLYRLVNPSKAPTDNNIEYIKVRIISWTKNRYYCQYITSGNIGGTSSFEVND